MSNKNKDVIRDYIENVFNARKIEDRFDDFFTTDIVVHGAFGTTGRDNLKKSVMNGFNAFPDLQITIEDLIAEGDRVVLRDSLTATHQGEILGIPATGKTVSWSAIWIYRMEDGKVVEMWGHADIPGLMQQLEAATPPGLDQD